MYESIEDKTIKYILSNHDSLQENIHSRVIEYYKELGTVDEFIRSASLNHNGSENLLVVIWILSYGFTRKICMITKKKSKSV